MADIDKAGLAYINKNFAKKPLQAEEVFGFSAVAARSDKVTSYNTRLDAVTLEAFAKSMKKSPVAMGVLHQNQLPVGRVYGGKLEGNALSVNFYALRNMTVGGSSGSLFGGGSGPVTTNDIERMIDAGTLSDVSVGFQADRNKYMCSLCKMPVMSPKCEHMPGHDYEGTKCVANIVDPNAVLHEVSVVMAGALPGAEIQSLSFDNKEDWFVKTTTNNGEMAYATFSMSDGELNREERGETELGDELDDVNKLDSELSGMKDLNVRLTAELSELKSDLELLKESNEKFASEYAELEGVRQELEQVNGNLKTQLAASEMYSKIGRHYDTALDFEINRLGVAVDGNTFDKDLMKKQLLGLSVEDKEKMRDAFCKKLGTNMKVGELEVEDVHKYEETERKVDDSHLYKV